MNRRHFLATSTLALASTAHAARFGRPPAQDEAQSLRQRATTRNLLYGCAVNVGKLQSDPSYAALVREQSNILVAENAMKWAPLRPTSTTYHFEEADALVAFAETNRIKIRGHNLAWHRQLPDWFAVEANTTNAARLLTDHIHTVAGRYSGRMHSWDVVNEAIHPPDGRADGLRDSPWLKLLGPGYIETAFRAARQADPEALLTYNDYGIEEENTESDKKRAAVLMLLRRLKARHVPLDAIGIQSHISAGPKHRYGPGLTDFMAQCRALDLQIFLTEMDVNDRDLPADIKLRDTAVAALYGSYLDTALADPAVRAVLTWGITDRYTWLNSEGARPDHQPERCLPFDTDLHPKPAVSAIRASIGRRP
jgi:endo-1,4-beta-xylanase